MNLTANQWSHFLKKKIKNTKEKTVSQKYALSETSVQISNAY